MGAAHPDAAADVADVADVADEHHAQHMTVTPTRPGSRIEVWMTLSAKPRSVDIELG